MEDYFKNVIWNCRKLVKNEYLYTIFKNRQNLIQIY